MNKSIDALKLALEALELCMSRPNYGAPWTEKAITICKQALAEQLAQEEPVSDTELINRGCHYQTELTKPAQQQDIPDLIAGALGVSRGTAYDLMREALAHAPTEREQPRGAATLAQQQEPVTDEENEKFSRDVSNFKGADPEATKYALEEFLKNRTAQQQKPVAEYIGECNDGSLVQLYDDVKKGAKLYTSPPANANAGKPWVGLTDEEIIEVIHPLVMADMADEATDYEIARAIEAKLRERNEHREKNA